MATQDFTCDNSSIQHDDDRQPIKIPRRDWLRLPRPISAMRQRTSVCAIRRLRAANLRARDPPVSTVF